jgi:hypothetical protein
MDMILHGMDPRTITFHYNETPFSSQSQRIIREGIEECKHIITFEDGINKYNIVLTNEMKNGAYQLIAK